MKILSVNLDPTPELNLGPIQMDKLGSTVVIAGKNGAGKSRLFLRIQTWVNGFKPVAELEESIAQYEAAVKIKIKNNSNHEKFVKGLKDLRITHAQVKMLSLTKDQKPILVQFVPKNLTLADPNTNSKAANQQHAKAVEMSGVANLGVGTFAKIQILQDRAWEANHQHATIDQTAAKKANSEYETLEDLVGKFLGTKITRSLDGEAQLFELSLGKSNLSDGQKVLLQLCIAIHAQASSLNEVIILMDEPENHLHPAALLDMIEVVQKHLEEGQLWIATHSVPLLANMPPSSIWWMEENTVKKAGDKPEKVLEGLLGDARRRDRLATFLDLPFVLASNRFAAECMIPPPTVPHRSGDSQTKQIFDTLSSLRKPGEPLRILDLGAGKGRLASELAEDNKGDESVKIDYIAFDPDDKDAEECRTAISLLHEDAEDRYFNDWNSLRARYDEGSFDVVVMCNVLHEIPPSGWGGLFGFSGNVSKMLREDGFLLLVEVQQLPYGEQAHEFGFLVFDTAQIRRLFAIKEDDMSGLKIDSRRDGWLKANLISQPLLERYSHDTLQDALKDLGDTAREKIEMLRGKGDKDYRSGRLHGFWVQQYANAMLAQD